MPIIPTKFETCPRCKTTYTGVHRCHKPPNENNRPPQSPEPQLPVQREPMGQEAGEAGDTKSVHVSVTSYRRRVIDPDNLCPKYFIDCLRYAGIITDDTAEAITLTVTQQKVPTKEAEKTVISIE